MEAHSWPVIKVCCAGTQITDKSKIFIVATNFIGVTDIWSSDREIDFGLLCVHQ